MAYKEPYPVETELPSPTGSKYKVGNKICYHFTLTYNQVKDTKNKLDYEYNHNSFGVPGKGNWFASMLMTWFKAPRPAGIALGLFQGYMTLVGENEKALCAKYLDIYSSVLDCMNTGGYKRVTFSQQLELRYLMGGYFWYPLQHIRVPDISYYYKK